MRQLPRKLGTALKGSVNSRSHRSIRQAERCLRRGGVEEPDGRLWLVAPSNAFGDYTATFPKGRIEGNGSHQASAIREAYEEAGLKVKIIGFLADSNRSQSYTRYYLAQRVGGDPGLMGWESQAVHLVPRAALGKFLTHPNDFLLRSLLFRLKN